MKFKIKVPATSANIGAGFDTVGVALTLYNEFTFDFSKTGVSFSDDQYTFDTSLTLDAFFETLERFAIQRPENLHLYTQSNIPIARGLGSSSTCIVAGVLAANHYANLKLSNESLGEIVSQIEGHPDNVISALYGNFNLSMFDKKLFNINTKVHEDLAFLAIVSNLPVKTSDARNILPTSYTLDQITFNLSRLPFYQKAFKEKNSELLKKVTQDKLHQNHRAKLIEDYELIRKVIKETQAITYWISGAGSTIIVLVDKNSLNNVYLSLKPHLSKETQILKLSVDTQGATIIDC